MDNIITLEAGRGRRIDRPPPLSDAELIQLRALLRDVRTIVHRCPVARMALDEAARS
jgi:hypothetical protein